MTETNSDNRKMWPVALGALVLLAWLTSWSLLLHFVESADRGAFGDMFGAVNSLFSGLAFAGLIVAIVLQKQELTETRKALVDQKDEMALQNKTMLKQSFENTFFQLLRLHGDIVGSIDLSNQKHPATGRDCFEKFYERLLSQVNILRHNNGGIGDLKSSYITFYSFNQSKIGHYYRSLYYIIKLIDQSDVDNKRVYTNLIRAQLSSYELSLLFYNCLSDVGDETLKPFVEKYSLLKNLDISLLIENEHTNLYAPSAFE